MSYPDHTFLTYTYDNDGNRLSMIDNSSSTYYTYDARDRPTSETQVLGGSSYTLNYAYDRASNIMSITYPGGYNLTYSYDPMERVSQVGTFVNFTYTLDNQISTITYGDGVKATYTYNSRDMPTRVHSVNGTTTLLDLNYTYDGVGNVLSINNQNYSYDALNRLTSGNGTWGTLVYKYDPAGNILQLINGSTTTNYSYGSYNRLLSAGNVNYTYNNDGDLVTKTTSSGTWNYYYNPLNELTSVALNGVSVENNTYNGDGQRIKSTTGSSSLTFMYQGTNLLYEKNLTSSISTERFYANGMVLSELFGTSLDYYLTDALGSVRLVLGGGSSIFSSNYAPFGSNAALSGFELLQYAERPLDESTGLYYMGARYYDPSTGRFITEDTYAGKKSDPSSLNRYVYAEDNPMRYIDPTGHRIAVPNSNGGYTVLPTNPYTSPSQVISEYKNFVASQNNVGSISSNTITTNTGGGGTTTNIAPTPTDLFVYWFFQDWLPTHESELALALVSIGLDVIGMSDVSAIIASLSKSALNAIVESITASWDIGELAGDFATKNISSAVWTIGSIVVHNIPTILRHVPWFDKVAIGIAGAGEEATNGLDGGATVAASAAAAAVTTGSLIYNIWDSWNAYII